MDGHIYSLTAYAVGGFYKLLADKCFRQACKHIVSGCPNLLAQPNDIDLLIVVRLEHGLGRYQTGNGLVERLQIHNIVVGCQVGFVILRIAEYHVGAEQRGCGSVGFACSTGCIVVELDAKFALQPLIGLHDHILHAVGAGAKDDLSYIRAAIFHFLCQGKALFFRQGNANMGRQQNFRTQILEFLDQHLLLSNHIRIHGHFVGICRFENRSGQRSFGVRIEGIQPDIHDVETCANRFLHQVDPVRAGAFIAVGNGHHRIVCAIRDTLEGIIVTIFLSQFGQMDIECRCAVCLHLLDSCDDLFNRRTLHAAVQKGRFLGGVIVSAVCTVVHQIIVFCIRNGDRNCSHQVIDDNRCRISICRKPRRDCHILGRIKHGYIAVLISSFYHHDAGSKSSPSL